MKIINKKYLIKTKNAKKNYFRGGMLSFSTSKELVMLIWIQIRIRSDPYDFGLRIRIDDAYLY